jgi:hypothetical protein
MRLIVVLSATILALSACGEGHVNYYRGLSTNNPTGAPVSGIAIGLTNDGLAFLGYPVWVTVEMRSTVTPSPRFEFGGYDFIIHNRLTGKLLRRYPETMENSLRPATASGPMCGRGLDDNQSFYELIPLDLAYPLTVPGSYSVTAVADLGIECKRHTVLSNTITITLFP